MNYQNYCNELRPDRTQFDKDLQNMWCPSCCVKVVSPSGPTGPSGRGGAKEESDVRGNVKVAGVY
jgi:hypothetical protein